MMTTIYRYLSFLKTRVDALASTLRKKATEDGYGRSTKCYSPIQQTDGRRQSVRQRYEQLQNLSLWQEMVLAIDHKWFRPPPTGVVGRGRGLNPCARVLLPL